MHVGRIYKGGFASRCRLGLSEIKDNRKREREKVIWSAVGSSEFAACIGLVANNNGQE